MSATTVVTQALKEASSLGLLTALGQVLSAIVQGKPSQAERLARNAALAASAKLAARARIKAMK